MDTDALPESATVRVCTSPLIGPAEHEATQLIDQLRRRALSLAADNVTTTSRKDMTLICICTLQVEISHAPHGPDAANLWLSSLAEPGLAEKVLDRPGPVNGRTMRLFKCAELLAWANKGEPLHDPAVRAVRDLLRDAAAGGRLLIGLEP